MKILYTPKLLRFKGILKERFIDFSVVFTVRCKRGKNMVQ